MTEYIIDIPEDCFPRSDTERAFYCPDERDGAMPIAPITRCRDCRFRCIDECTRIDEGFKDYWFAIEFDGFCAWGERKEQ